MREIIRKLRNAKIIYADDPNHYHWANFVVRWIQRGKRRYPKLILIDFDLAYKQPSGRKPPRRKKKH